MFEGLMLIIGLTGVAYFGQKWKVMDMDSKKLNVYGRTIGEEVLSKYK